jgi:acetyltransferase-like isoleucine patch superfamily enzyme
MSAFSRSFLNTYRLRARGRSKLFSMLAGGAFASFGSHSVLELPVRVAGERRIAIGTGVFVGAGSWLQALGAEEGVAIEIGDGTSIAGSCVISAAVSVRLGAKVLLARNVYIADHSHRFATRGIPVLDQGIDRIAAVEIGEGAWLGQNVVVGPGVRIGAGAVIGANAVVLHDVPERAVAVGAPARVVRLLDAPLVPA